MELDFRAQMFGGNKRKINNQTLIEAVLHDSTASPAISDSLIHITFRQ